jgi:transcription antitermination factor NusG
MAYWAAARVRSNETARAVRNVERLGFEVYNPICRPSRRSLRTAPLFVGYAFVAIEDRWRCLLTAGGVIDIIRAGDAPAVVKPYEIERMKNQEGRDGVITLPVSRFRDGERLRVVRGPFLDRIGIYAGMTARDRIKIMFTMFEREVQIELRERDVVSA